MLLDYATTGRVREELTILQVCERYGWTHEEFYAQPEWFTDLAIEKMRIEATMK